MVFSRGTQVGGPPTPPVPPPPVSGGGFKGAAQVGGPAVPLVGALTPDGEAFHRALGMMVPVEPLPGDPPWNSTYLMLADRSVVVLPLAFTYPLGGSSGSGDDGANITNAFGFSSVVRLAPVTYAPTTPIVFPAWGGAKLVGLTGATQGGAGSPGVSATIRPTSAWAAAGGFTAIIQAGQAARQSVEDLWVDGTNIATANIDGVNFAGTGGVGAGHNCSRVGVDNCTGYGVNAVAGLGFLGQDLIIQNCTDGGYLCGVVDSQHYNVHAQNNQNIQFTLTGGDQRCIGCRGDGDGTTGSTHGFSLTSFNGTGALGLGHILIGCSTGGNLHNGVICSGGGTNVEGPYKLNGCSFQTDGGGGTYAAIECIGRVDVSVTDCDVSTDITGAHPAYCLQTDQNSGSKAVPDIVSVIGGLWQAGTGFVNDAGPATAHQISGTMGFLGAQNGTTGTTSFAAVAW